MYPGYTFAVGQSEAGNAMQTQKLAIFVWPNSVAVRTFGAEITSRMKSHS